MKHTPQILYNSAITVTSVFPSAAIDLIKKLLTLNPKQRISTAEALRHPWMQDNDVIARAKELMGQAANSTTSMPPPPKPVGTQPHPLVGAVLIFLPAFLTESQEVCPY